jgi:hypothetical protein
MSSVFKVEEPETPAQTTPSDRPIFGDPEPASPVSAEPAIAEEEAAPLMPEPVAAEPAVEEMGPPTDEEGPRAVEGFDEPEPGDLQTHKPDPFLNDLLTDREQPAPPEPARTPAPPAPSPQGPQVDRSTVVRELAGLFSDDERTTPRPEAQSETAAAGVDQRKRIEDDDQLNKGLITRLIDGVKGL